MSDYLDPNNEELLNDFFEEARIQIEQLEQNILVLENDATDKDCIDELFRAAHTLKGAAATVAITELAELTHVLEDVLDEVREGHCRVTRPVVDALLVAVDVIKSMVDCRMEGSVYRDQGVEELKTRLHNLLGDAEPDSAAPASSSGSSENEDEAAAGDDSAPVLDEDELTELLELLESSQKLFQIRVFFDESALMNTIGGIQVYAALKNEGTILKTIPDFEALNEDIFHPEVYYFVASQSDIPSIRDLVSISDVTTGSEITELTEQTLDRLRENKKESVTDSFESRAAGSETAASPVDSAETEDNSGAAASQKKSAETVNDKKGSKKQSQSSILRVDSKKIDSLLNMISESVINKSTINQVSDVYHQLITEFRSLNSKMENEVSSLFDILDDYPVSSEEEDLPQKVRTLRERCVELMDRYDHFEDKFKKNADDLKNSTQKLALNTGSLQEGIMQIRMVPISTLFARFPRLVRDLSHSLNKKVDLILEGEDTELDKSIVEDLLDPLIHCVRNSLDHGLENAETRAALGKPETGTVVMKAGNEGSMIVIEVSDDGAGINADKVRQKAVEKGLISSDAPLTEQEVHNLIFLPGFSTSDTISSISGRGVGLDVVRTQIEKLKGTIQVTSRKGAGTAFIIRLPLTLAIIQGLLIRSATSKFVIPINSVIDSHRILKDQIKLIEGREVFKIRDELIYILRLSRIFGLPPAKEQRVSAYEYMVIIGNEERKLGLIVDSLLGEEDVVIKPLKDKYSKTFGIAGATILGDGSVSLIIDVQQLLERVQSHSGESDYITEEAVNE